VPGVDSVDECSGGRPVDLVQASAGGIATFAVFASPNVSYSYTVDGAIPAIAVVFDPDTLPPTAAGASFIMPGCVGHPGPVSLTNAGGVIRTLSREGVAVAVADSRSYDVTPCAAVNLTAELEGPEGSWTWNDPEQRMMTA